MTNGSLMNVESIAEYSPWSILQYFWPALSDNWSWKTIFGLFESGRFTQALLYSDRVHSGYGMLGIIQELLSKMKFVYMHIPW